MMMRRLRKCQSPLQADKIILLVGIFVLMSIWSGLSGCGTTGAIRGTGKGDVHNPLSSSKAPKGDNRGEMQTLTKAQGIKTDSNGTDQVTLLFEQAIHSLEVGREDQALEGLKQVVSLSPQLSVPHNNLGIIYKRKGLLDKAIEEYKEAIRLKADYAEAYNNLGIAYREKGLFKQAELAYREALRLKSDLAEAHYNLGVLYELYLNRPKEAIGHYRDYLRRGGQNKKEVELWISALEQKLNPTIPLERNQ